MGVWNARNKLLFENIHQTPGELIDIVKQWLQEYMIVQLLPNGGGQKCMIVEKWRPLESGYCSIAVDGAFKRELAGAGVIIRDAEGDVLAAMAAGLHGVTEAGHAEILGIWGGMELANESMITNSVIESNCSTVGFFLYK